MKSFFSVAWVLAYISIASVSAAIITPSLPDIKTAFHLSLGSVEWVVSAFLVGYVLGQLIYGPLANAYGRLKSLRLGLIINLFGLVICLTAVYVGSYFFLVFGRFVTGLGAASGLACTFMLINEWLPEQSRKTAMAYSILSFALGIGLAVMLGGVITQYWAWQGCFIILLIQGVVMLWGTRVFDETLKKPKPINLKSLLHGFRLALSSYKLVMFSMLVGTCSMIGYCFSAAAPDIARSYFHISVSEYGYWNGVNIIGMLVGGLSARELLQRFSTYHVIGLGFLGCSLGVFGLVLIWWFGCHQVAWFFVTTAMLYLFSSYLFAGGSYVASNAIEDKASASSMMSFVNMSFATLSVIVMGYLSHDPFVAFISILASVLALMCVWFCFSFIKDR